MIFTLSSGANCVFYTEFTLCRQHEKTGDSIQQLVRLHICTAKDVYLIFVRAEFVHAVTIGGAGSVCICARWRKPNFA